MTSLRTRARLPHHERELVVELAGENLVRHLRNERGVPLVHAAKRRVCQRGGLLEHRKRADYLVRHALGAYGEILVASLGLGAPKGVCGDKDLSHRVVLAAVLHVLALLFRRGLGRGVLGRGGALDLSGVRGRRHLGQRTLLRGLVACLATLHTRDNR